MRMDRAIEAAAKVLRDRYEPYSDEAVKAMSIDHYRSMARLAVEAAAPFLGETSEDWVLENQRAERAEAEVEQQREYARNAWEQADAYIQHMGEGWTLSDQLAEALKNVLDLIGPDPATGVRIGFAALAAYEDFRNGSIHD